MPRRISVVGTSGSGKTTWAKRIADRLAVPFVELDAINHQPGWTPLDRNEFRRRIAELADTDAWVIDGNYRSVVGEVIWKRADTVVWLDPPRWVVMRQIVGRTLRRMATREELWNGNREQFRTLLRREPEENIILWAWTRHHAYRELYEAAMTDPAFADLQFVRLRSHAEATAWLEALEPEALSADRSDT